MSRGHGVLERLIIEKILRFGPCEVAFLHFPVIPFRSERPINNLGTMGLTTRSHRSSVNRAIRNLERAGKFEKWELADGTIICKIGKPLVSKAYNVAGRTVVAHVMSVPIRSVTLEGVRFLKGATPDHSKGAAIEVAGVLAEQKGLQLQGYDSEPSRTNKKLLKAVNGLVEGQWNVISRIAERVVINNELPAKLITRLIERPSDGE